MLKSLALWFHKPTLKRWLGLPGLFIGPPCGLIFLKNKTRCFVGCVLLMFVFMGCGRGTNPTVVVTQTHQTPTGSKTLPNNKPCSGGGYLSITARTTQTSQYSPHFPHYSTQPHYAQQAVGAGQFLPIGTPVVIAGLAPVTQQGHSPVAACYREAVHFSCVGRATPNGFECDGLAQLRPQESSPASSEATFEVEAWITTGRNFRPHFSSYTRDGFNGVKVLLHGGFNVHLWGSSPRFPGSPCPVRFQC